MANRSTAPRANGTAPDVARQDLTIGDAGASEDDRLAMPKSKISNEGFMVRCLGCSYSARFGVARINAELACVKHRNRFHHQIGLYQVQLAYLFGELEGQQTLIFDDDKPPF